jgi:hypothetical protein
MAHAYGTWLSCFASSPNGLDPSGFDPLALANVRAFIADYARTKKH